MEHGNHKRGIVFSNEVEDDMMLAAGITQFRPVFKECACMHGALGYALKMFFKPGSVALGLIYPPSFDGVTSDVF